MAYQNAKRGSGHRVRRVNPECTHEEKNKQNVKREASQVSGRVLYSVGTNPCVCTPVSTHHRSAEYMLR